MNLLKSLPSLGKSDAKRVGRGYGSAKGGHTSGRGQKGQRSRTGSPKVALWFEGGQLPLIKRLPMLRGKGRFGSLKRYQEVQLRDVVAKGLKEVTPATLQEAGLTRPKYGTPRLVGAVELTAAMKTQDVTMSSSVQKAIEAAGGTVTL